jgi:predicted nuclease of restriction endonuclease-like RecB superfamily
MELLKCGQCGDRPGMLVTVTYRATGIEINLCYKCYKMYARHIKGLTLMWVIMPKQEWIMQGQ